MSHNRVWHQAGYSGSHPPGKPPLLARHPYDLTAASHRCVWRAHISSIIWSPTWV
jgi:hypothetical protein